eukprot:CAMPEP_0181267910 /NCGR_PEP_ID=MMETSP1097-20121128/5194_1 /TAXON_ID=35684 /ORGANISM="Pseudopedinella elastica, Strain CCMP716" /LENGTH=57 /DNA_ID=CAMNT_0023367453 /DNA_START=197 /DNA_END=370 /DNA_ORIENTATION=+
MTSSSSSSSDSSGGGSSSHVKKSVSWNRASVLPGASESSSSAYRQALTPSSSTTSAS